VAGRDRAPACAITIGRGRVDADLIAVAPDAVAQGRAQSVSAWVNEALRLTVAHDRRRRALDEFVAMFEAEHGEITEAEMGAAARPARGRAVVVGAAQDLLTRAAWSPRCGAGGPAAGTGGPAPGRGGYRWAG
jgi:hypothetical protein